MPNSKIIAFLNYKNDTVYEFLEEFRNERVLMFENGFEYYQWIEASKKGADVIIAKGRYNSPNCKGLLTKLKADNMLKNIPIIFILDKITPQIIQEAHKDGVTEIFDVDSSTEDISRRIKFILNNPVKRTNKPRVSQKYQYKTPLSKRLFDIVFSLFALTLLSPLFLLVAILIRLESKGPIFYYSMRVGTGYNIFKFYKFRSMYTGADAKLKELAHLNQYKADKEEAEEKAEENPVESIQEDRSINSSEEIIEVTSRINKDDQQVLYMDGKAITEEEYSVIKKAQEAGTFIKIKNDPRITKVGKIIRNTSIDELPQLFNVLKGDMSIVGNRPLPLYEAEKLTTDRFSLRFMAPAGITGLWQVSKRGKGEMSEEERMQLDNDYAKNVSLWNDIKLIMRTIPALLQKENV